MVNFSCILRHDVTAWSCLRCEAQTATEVLNFRNKAESFSGGRECMITKIQSYEDWLRSIHWLNWCRREHCQTPTTPSDLYKRILPSIFPKSFAIEGKSISRWLQNWSCMLQSKYNGSDSVANWVPHNAGCRFICRAVTSPIKSASVLANCFHSRSTLLYAIMNSALKTLDSLFPGSWRVETSVLTVFLAGELSRPHHSPIFPICHSFHNYSSNMDSAMPDMDSLVLLITPYLQSTQALAYIQGYWCSAQALIWEFTAFKQLLFSRCSL
jgi:hypothetical protein